MKKRIACLLLTLVMLVGLIPATAIRASAAGFAISEAGIRVIKEYMGFHKNAYETYTGSNVYKIGYGTASVKGATITEANADKLLREQLALFAAELDKAFGSTALVQNRMDALIWYSYIEGLGWAASGNALFEAAKANKTGSELADAMCTWDYDVSGFTDNATSRAVLNRRMRMANMYINNVYSASDTGSLAYTVLNAGDTATLPGGIHRTVQAYVKSSSTAINVGTPTFGTAKFLGWYLNGEMITGLSSATAGKTLNAKWQETEASVKAEYTIPAELIYITAGAKDEIQIYIYQQPSEDSLKVNVLNRQTSVTVVAEKVVGSDKWLNLSTGGWVKLGSVSNVPATIPTTVVTITDDYVNIRLEPSATSTKLGTIQRGEQRTITMISNDGRWGYCYQGWIFLAYTSYFASTTPSGGSDVSAATGTPGTVTGASNVNVRVGPGVGNALATTLAEGTAVTVYEQKTVDSASWGRIDQGWISMGYVKLQQTTTSTGGSSISTGSSAVVSSSVSLNVRSGPGTIYSKVSTLAPGTSVVILRKETVDGATWGLIDQGWINLSYVTPIGSSSGSSSVYSVGGTVVNCSSGVNIRAAAGTNNALVGVAALNSRVYVTEITTVSGYQWGHIDRGWVCMDYVQLDSQFQPPQATTPTVEDEPDNIVTSFQGYPATVNAGGADLWNGETGKTLLTLTGNTTVNILSMTASAGKVTVGDKTGWVDLDKVTMNAFNAKVTASKADVYEEPSTRSTFFGSLVQGTYITVPQGNENWKVSDGVLWGKVTVSTSGATHTGWLKLSDVTMFKNNTMPTGITTYNGAGYITGVVYYESTLYKDDNGNVSSEASGYTLTVGTRVNVLARNYQPSTGVTYAKVTMGSVTGWIDLGNLGLEYVPMLVNSNVQYYTSLENVQNGTVAGTVTAGNRFTVTWRYLVPNSNEINHGITDVGMGYLNDDASNVCYIVLDDGRLTPTGKPTTDDPSNPLIASSVVITGKAKSELSIYEEAIESSNVLLKLSTGTAITVLNWQNVAGTTWGKVQINKVVGWVKADQVSFSGLTGVAGTQDLSVYSAMDKASSVQVLRVNGADIQIEEITLTGNVLWGKIIVGEKVGYVDLANLTLTPVIDNEYDPNNLPAIAKGKVNSVNATVNITNGEVQNLPKGTEVTLLQVKIESGKAKWLVDLGDKDGWIDMDYLTMYSAIATITESSASIYNDLQAATEELYTLYRGEKITVLSFHMADDGCLYGEVAYDDSTGWIRLCDTSNKMYVSLVPGSTGSSIGGGTGSGTGTTEPTTPTVTATDAYISCASFVNVRAGAGVDKALVTTLENGTNVKIYEQTTVLGKQWARIDQGWVCMDYVKLGTLINIPSGGTATNGGSGTATIMTSVPAGAIAVGYANTDIKIRSGSGLGYPEVGSVAKGYSIVIYENKLDGGMSWGRTDNGWVCTSYLTLTGIGTAGSGNMGTIASGGFTVNVRGTANSYGALMAVVMVSSRVAIHETTVVGTETWGRTDLGWINMQYVVLDSAAAPVPGTPDATTPTETADTSVG